MSPISAFRLCAAVGVQRPDRRSDEPRPTDGVVRCEVVWGEIEMVNDAARGRTEGKAPWSGRFGDAPAWGLVALSIVIVGWTLVKGAYYQQRPAESLETTAFRA